ncbi:neprilysin-2 [Microplitis demolitor]|uniref:neprilysin-2 n=1 Tax=Microplitis demolitor TaxID=69319 RepID=UPI0004CD213D|nr:neprilysin-2 [Microplitis demolitor]
MIWGKKTLFSKQTFVIIFIAIISLSKGKPIKPAKVSNVCRTQECIDTASKVIKYMDPTVNPCDNFYKFTCGNFINTTKIPDDKDSVDIFSTITEQVHEQLKSIVESDISQNLSRPFRLINTMYNICMNQSAIEKDGLSPLLSKLNKLGGWPVLQGNKWNEDTFNWTNSLYLLRDMGYSVEYLFGFEIESDYKNNTRKIININLPELAFDSELLSSELENKLINEYKKYMINIAVLLGAKRQYAAHELKKALLFEMKLANISLQNEKAASKRFELMTVAELEKNYPSIPWLEYFNKILEPHVILDKNEEVCVHFPNVISDFEKLMKETSKRTQANYIIWRVIVDSVPYLNNEIREKQFDFLTAITGLTERVPRSNECLSIISSKMSLIISALYVRKYFYKDAKNNTIEMVNNIKNQLKKTLKTVDWMDERTRKHALAKADAMISHIGYADELLYDEKLEKIFKNFQLNYTDSYLQAILNLKLHKTDTVLRQFRIPINKNDWMTYVDPIDVDAYYLAFQNIIQIPAAILQGDFYNKNRPRYMNYGAIGCLIGHEVTRGFDTTGKLFDKNGNMVDWWEPSTNEKYIEKSRCFIDQYNNYIVKEVEKNISGLTTLNGNIADNGGIKIAYLSYKTWAKSQKSEPRLPGLERFSPNQMFWISLGQMWCSIQRPEALNAWLLIDDHSPGEFRVLGSLSNMKEFSDDFKCPLGSPMNPKNKCAVW